MILSIMARRVPALTFLDFTNNHYGAEAAPEVVYMNRKNFTHPFSSTCDIQISCGVEGDNEDTSDNMGSSYLQVVVVALCLCCLVDMDILSYALSFIYWCIGAFLLNVSSVVCVGTAMI